VGDVRRELSNPPGVHPPQAHYSHVARAGQTLYISGQLAMDASGAVVGVGDARAQARQCYANLTAILAHYGGRLGHLVKTTTYITHWAYRPLVATARDAAVEVTAHAVVRAPAELIWQTLTDYEHLSRFVPGIVSSRVVSRQGTQLIVEQRGGARLWFFSYPIRVVLASREVANLFPEIEGFRTFRVPLKARL